MSLQQITGLYFGPSVLHGRGVFCATDIPEGSTIEIAPVILLSDLTAEQVEQSSLYNYCFLWGTDEEVPAIALGYGVLYNHCDDPNADTVQDIAEKTVVFTARRNIPAGEEICIDYRLGLGDKPLWFEKKD